MQLFSTCYRRRLRNIQALAHECLIVIFIFNITLPSKLSHPQEILNFFLYSCYDITKLIYIFKANDSQSSAMNLCNVSILLFFLSFLDMYTSLSSGWDSSEVDITISINSENHTFSMPRRGQKILDLGTARPIDQARIVSTPVQNGNLRCFFNSPSSGQISEIFHEFLPFPGIFPDAEYLNCFGRLEEEESLVFLERANGLPMLLRSEPRRRGTFDVIDVGPVSIRRAALIDPSYDVSRCDLKFADGSVKSLKEKEMGRVVEMIGTMVGMACREKWSLRKILPSM